VEVRPVCINASRWDCTLESVDATGRFAVRLGLRMVWGLANGDGAALVAARSEPFASVEDLWPRAGNPVASITQLAEADAFRWSLGLARRDALWAIKVLRDEPLPLFAAATERETRRVSEIIEPALPLQPMTAGGEVVEDYGHVGLTLRSHPVSFLRNDLNRRHIVTCAEAMAARDKSWLTAAGLVLVRQRPGSVKGVLFVTMEDETGIANLAIWPTVVEKRRRVILGAGMLACRGRIQREVEVAHHLTDLSAELASVGDRETDFPLPHDRGDQVRHGGSGPDPRELPPKGLRTRDIYVPDLHIDTIKVKPRDFR